MHLYFIDDSGTISPPNKITQSYFVLGGLIIPEDQWRQLESVFSKICGFFGVKGEIKWRYFGQKHGREDKENTLAHLDVLSRDDLRRSLLSSLTANSSIKMIVGVIHLPTLYSSLEINTPEQVHALMHGTLLKAYQHYLLELSQMIGSNVNGIIISDHRNPMQDAALRNLHMNILKSENPEVPNYPNLIENLFLAPSHHSIGIQFADLISGSVFRYFEHKDDRWYRLLKQNFWESSTDLNIQPIQIMGNMKEKDAESIESLDPTEPTLMT